MKIGEMVKKTGLSANTLRYYEKKGLIRVQRDQYGRRVYSEQDIAWVQFIQRLKETGMLLRDIRRYSELRYQGDSTMAERLAMLKVHRQYVLAQQAKWEANLARLDRKIDIYQEKIKQMTADN